MPNFKTRNLFIFRGNTAGNSAGSSPTNISRANGFFLTEPVGGSALFASSRAWIAGNTNPPTRIDTSRPSPVEPLFVVSNYGSLVEFNIDIQPLKNSPQSEEMPFEAVAEGKGKWIFCRHATAPESKSLLSEDNLLCKTLVNMNKQKKNTSSGTYCMQRFHANKHFHKTFLELTFTNFYECTNWCFLHLNFEHKKIF